MERLKQRWLTLPPAAGEVSPCDMHEFGMLGFFMPARTCAKVLWPLSDVPIPQVADWERRWWCVRR